MKALNELLNELSNIEIGQLSIEAKADLLGLTLAAKADIAKMEKSLKADFVHYSALDPVIEGDIFRVTVSHVETSRSDWKKIANKLEPSRQLVTAYTKVSESDRVSVKSKVS